MTNKKYGITKASMLKGASICVKDENQSIVKMYFKKKHKIKVNLVHLDNNEEIIKAFLGQRCDACAMGTDDLNSAKMQAKKPSRYVILPDVINLIE